MGKRAWGVGFVVAAVLLAPAAAGAAKPPKPPQQWDPRVRELVKFVERDRDLKFAHPFAVEFLDDEAFVAALNEGDEPTKADRKAAEHDAAQLRATGMIGPDVDLLDAWSGIDDTTTTGFYDPDTKKLYVRGDDLTDTDIRLTVVHELTHALQDQHFDLGKLDESVRNSGQGFAEDALIEGDATTVEDDYFFSLPQREQDAYNSGEGGANDVTAPPDEIAPSGAPMLDAFDAAPYNFGSQFVSQVFDERGAEGVDARFRSLPRSEEEIIDPVATSEREKPVKVAAPKLASGDKAVGAPDTWGAFSLYLMLAARIDRATALTAAEGWGGDSYRAFTNADGVECVRAAFAGDTTNDVDEIAAALDEWTAHMPAGGVTTARAGRLATFTACDVGGVTSPDEQQLLDATDLLYDRNHFAQGLIADDVPPELARCAGAKMGLDPEIVAAEWGDTEPTDAEMGALQDRVDRYLIDCTREVRA